MCLMISATCFFPPYRFNIAYQSSLVPYWITLSTTVLHIFCQSNLARLYSHSIAGDIVRWEWFFQSSKYFMQKVYPKTQYD